MCRHVMGVHDFIGCCVMIDYAFSAPEARRDIWSLARIRAAGEEMHIPPKDVSIHRSPSFMPSKPVSLMCMADALFETYQVSRSIILEAVKLSSS
jgi:hypothetical protein